MSDRLHFEMIKERREGYFTEYLPPVADHTFATLNLVFFEAFNPANVAELMESELRYWLHRYAVPLMSWAYDEKENSIQAGPGNGDTCLAGWINPTTSEVTFAWDIDIFSAFLKLVPPNPDWRTIYTDVPFKTDIQVKAEADKRHQIRRKQIRVLKIAAILWLAVAPSAWAIFEYFGPEWVGALVLAYSLWKSYQAWRRLMGYHKPSPAEEEEAEKERRMKHYFYHCERNPLGFSRLKAENFEDDARKKIQKEASSLMPTRDSEFG